LAVSQEFKASEKGYGRHEIIMNDVLLWFETTEFE
jgi:hypothetical protein